MAVYGVEVGLGVGRLQAKRPFFSQGVGLGAVVSASPGNLLGMQIFWNRA